MRPPSHMPEALMMMQGWSLSFSVIESATDSVTRSPRRSARIWRRLRSSVASSS